MQNIDTTGYKQAQSELEDMQEMLKRLAAKPEDIEAIEEDLDYSILSHEFRSDWHSSSSEFTIAEARIVLCVGGPYVAAYFKLNALHEATAAHLEYAWGSHKGTLVDCESILLKWYNAFFAGAGFCSP